MNTVITLGKITRDIELKHAGNTEIVNFSIAVNKKYKDKQGQLVENTSFIDITAFGTNAKTIANFFKKGSNILVQGELEQSTWKTQQGENRSKTFVKLLSFDFIDKKESRQTHSPQERYDPNTYGGNDEMPY